jgi:N6-adenosine-specific RNA methylase IME4
MFEELKHKNYDVICADPPWTFETYSDKGYGKSAQKHYKCMSLTDIYNMPVMDLAKPDCYLCLWATNPMLPQALETMSKWGFKYITNITWVKLTKHDKLAFGTGYTVRCATEQILIGKIGKPKIADRSIRTALYGQTNGHSRKPDEFYDMVKILFGADKNRVELFARQSRDGFDTWGDESTKFDVKL